MQRAGAMERKGRNWDGGFAWLAKWAMALGMLLVQWQANARERAQLATLSDAALKDVGLTRCDVFAELQKPRWRR